MASDITPGNIDGTYPIAGVPNDSQGFRTNFTNTSTNFAFAKAEIESLQVGVPTPTATTAELEAVGNAINTTVLKIAGYMVFNTTSGAPVWAIGNADSSVWNDATGALAHTPV